MHHYLLFVIFLRVCSKVSHFQACKTQSVPHSIMFVISWCSMWSIPLLCSTWTSKSMLSFTLKPSNHVSGFDRILIPDIIFIYISFATFLTGFS